MRNDSQYKTKLVTHRLKDRPRQLCTRTRSRYVWQVECMLATWVYSIHLAKSGTQRAHSGEDCSPEVVRRCVGVSALMAVILILPPPEAFRSRCKYFSPPLSDVEARKWWDAAEFEK
jgi:hypothetical protein